MAAWTIKALLEWITPHLTDKGVDSPRLCAEFLLTEVLDMQRMDLYTQFNTIVSAEHLAILRDLVKRAGEHEPVAYLVGKSEFYSIELNIKPGCSIPRPETELLVQECIDILREHNTKQTILDLCTGSACIAIALAMNYKDAHITASDISAEALAIAQTNIKKHALEQRINLVHGDLFEPIDSTCFDIIVCNPPYIAETEYKDLDKNVRDYEPKLALCAGIKGLDLYQRIIEQVHNYLKPNAYLLLEIGYNQADALENMINNTGQFKCVCIKKDFQGHTRVVIAQKNS